MKTYTAPQIKTHNFHGMLSSASKMQEFFELVARVARTDSAVLIRGESGTGKELVARAIHNLGSRHAQSFQAVNCAMLTSELVNSELFGHAKGAFTGAVTDHKGYFEAAHKGTLFLDEVAELPIDAQSRLLRAIQEKVITKVGSTKTQSIDVRILSATHRALRNEVKRGSFREDLMYRLRVVPIFLPRLVERGRDVEVLAWRFIEEFNRFGRRNITTMNADARDAILSYDWPGNIRELRNNIEYAFAVGEGPSLTMNDLPPELRGEQPPGDFEELVALDYQMEERKKIIQAINDAAGNKGVAADALGMSRSTLWRKMKSFGIAT